MIYITRKEHFNAAHKLYNSTWDEAKNFEVFGKCANKNWHGHNFDQQHQQDGDDRVHHAVEQIAPHPAHRARFEGGRSELPAFAGRKHVGHAQRSVSAMRLL